MGQAVDGRPRRRERVVTTERCLCCDLPVESCGTAVAAAQAAEERAVRSRALEEPGVVAAAYPGNCATCGLRYAKGDPVGHTEDGWSMTICCPRED